MRRIDVLPQRVCPSERLIAATAPERLDASVYVEVTLKVGDVRVALIAVLAVVIVNAVVSVGVPPQHGVGGEQPAAYRALASLHGVALHSLKRETSIQTRVIIRTRWRSATRTKPNQTYGKHCWYTQQRSQTTSLSAEQPTPELVHLTSPPSRLLYRSAL